MRAGRARWSFTAGGRVDTPPTTQPASQEPAQALSSVMERRGKANALAVHEAKCRRCGRCCTVKYVVAAHVFTTTHYCEHFDEQARRCRVYGRRRQVNPHCLDVETGIRLGVFPADCPYVAGIGSYVAPYPVPLDPATEEAVRQGRVQTADEVIRRLAAAASGTSGARPDPCTGSGQQLDEAGERDAG